MASSFSLEMAPLLPEEARSFLTPLNAHAEVFVETHKMGRALEIDAGKLTRAFHLATAEAAPSNRSKTGNWGGAVAAAVKALRELPGRKLQSALRAEGASDASRAKA